MLDEAQDWIQKDENLSDLLIKIKGSSKTDEEAALTAYHQVAEMLQLPKTFSDITEDSYEADEEQDRELHSVFEELAIINYLEPNQNILDRVLVALYIVYMKAHIDYEQAALKYYGSKEKVPKPYFIFFFGRDVDAHISFDIPKEFNSWPESGAVGLLQIGF